MKTTRRLLAFQAKLPSGGVGELSVPLRLPLWVVFLVMGQHLCMNSGAVNECVPWAGDYDKSGFVEVDTLDLPLLEPVPAGPALDLISSGVPRQLHTLKSTTATDILEIATRSRG